MSIVTVMSGASAEDQFRTANDVKIYIAMQNGHVDDLWKAVATQQNALAQLESYRGHIDYCSRICRILCSQHSIPNQDAKSYIDQTISWLSQFYLPKHLLFLDFVTQQTPRIPQQDREIWIHKAVLAVKGTLEHLTRAQNLWEGVIHGEAQWRGFREFCPAIDAYCKNIAFLRAQCDPQKNNVDVEHLHLQWLVDCYIPFHTSLLKCIQIPSSFPSDKEREAWVQEVFALMTDSLQSFTTMVQKWKLDDLYRELELQGFSSFTDGFTNYHKLFIELRQISPKSFHPTIDDFLNTIMLPSYQQFSQALIDRTMPLKQEITVQEVWVHKMVPLVMSLLHSLNNVIELWHKVSLFNQSSRKCFELIQKVLRIRIMMMPAECTCQKSPDIDKLTSLHEEYSKTFAGFKSSVTRSERESAKQAAQPAHTEVNDHP